MPPTGPPPVARPRAKPRRCLKYTGTNATLGICRPEGTDWVPADLAARVIVETVHHFLTPSPPQPSTMRKRMKKKKANAHFFHIVNPRQAQWSDLVSIIQQHLGPALKTVPFIDWVDMLKSSVEESDGFRVVDEGLNPAGKLIEFFDNLQDRAIGFPYARVAQLETVQTVKVSKTLAQLEAVNDDWVDLWMKQWGWNASEAKAVIVGEKTQG